VSREGLFAAFFFAVFFFLLYQFYLFLAGFFAPLVWAAILALAFYPLTTVVVRLFRGNRGLAALALLFTVLIVVVLPSIYLGSVLVEQATGAYRRVQDAVARGEVGQLLEQVRASRPGRLVEWATSHLGERPPLDPAEILLRATNAVSSEIVGGATALARNVLLTLLYFVIMLVALYFLFRDGERIADWLRDLIPMEAEHKARIFSRLYTTLTAVVQSMVLTAVAQGVLAGIGYRLIGGLHFSVFLGFLTALASFVPLAGPTFVWGGTALYLLLADEMGRAIGLTFWGSLLVSTADNWIKPLFIGGRANLPTFPLLLSLLGGLRVYGFLGVFLGPVILAILFTFLEIYREEYHTPAEAL
jgi:predicted PurR-regulated permease PerM